MFQKGSFSKNIKTNMPNDDKIKDEKLQYDINREASKYLHYHQVKLINMNILLVKKPSNRS